MLQCIFLRNREFFVTFIHRISISEQMSIIWIFGRTEYIIRYHVCKISMYKICTIKITNSNRNGKQETRTYVRKYKKYDIVGVIRNKLYAVAFA